MFKGYFKGNAVNLKTFCDDVTNLYKKIILYLFHIKINLQQISPRQKLKTGLEDMLFYKIWITILVKLVTLWHIVPLEHTMD